MTLPQPEDSSIEIVLNKKLKKRENRPDERITGVKRGDLIQPLQSALGSLVLIKMRKNVLNQEYFHYIRQFIYFLSNSLMINKNTFNI
jgi:hypothetical protein